MDRKHIGVAAGAVVLAVAGFAAASKLDVLPITATEKETPIGLVAEERMGCEDWSVQLTQGECFAAGVIRNVSLPNLQGALQFCKWKAANPGEWSRLNGFAQTEAQPANIVTWLGSHIKNDIEAYFAAGGPTFQIPPNTAPNVCKTPLKPPVVVGVTPDETDVTVTVTTP